MTEKENKKKTPLFHKFNIKSIYELVKILTEKNNTKKLQQFHDSKSFLEFLNSEKTLDFSTFTVPFNDPLYRITPKQYQTTSIIGSITYGGRYNIGGSQFQKSIEIEAFAALYLSSNLKCAEDEYTHGTKLTSNDIKYKLIPSKTFQLWDVEKVIQKLDFPNLNELVNKGGIENWGHCKIPMPSQILSFWLKEIDGDGILFKSTHDSKSHCIALFAKDDNESKSFFTNVSILK